MASKVGIVNMALSHLGSGKEIANFTTEKSEEAAAARRFYDTALGFVLRDFPWPFATRYVALGLVEADPVSEWAYSYRYPSDCKYLRKIPSGIRNDYRASRVPYIIASDDTGRLIYTDQQNAEIVYTVGVTNTALYPDDFVLAFSFYLAKLMAKRLTAGDPFKLGDKAMADYLNVLSTAVSRAFHDQQEEEAAEVEFIRERE